VKVNLCCDCLAINEHGINTCPKCGGDSCWCEGCQKTANLLLEGVRDYKKLDLKSPIEQWNSVTGIRSNNV